MDGIGQVAAVLYPNPLLRWKRQEVRVLSDGRHLIAHWSWLTQQGG